LNRLKIGLVRLPSLVAVVFSWCGSAHAQQSFDYCCSIASTTNFPSDACTFIAPVPSVPDGCWGPSLGPGIEGFDLTSTAPSGVFAAVYDALPPASGGQPWQGLCRAHTASQADPDDCLIVDVGGNIGNYQNSALKLYWTDTSFPFYQLCYGAAPCTSPTTSGSARFPAVATPSGSCCTAPITPDYFRPSGAMIGAAALIALGPFNVFMLVPGFACGEPPQPLHGVCGAQSGLLTPDYCGHVGPPMCGTGAACVSSACCATTCAAASFSCGSFVDCLNTTVDCGTCPSGQVCNGSTGEDNGSPGTCCTPSPNTCSVQHPGAACGTVPDGCGGQSACGSLGGACPTGEHCANFVCVPGAPTPTPAMPLAGVACLASLLLVAGTAFAKRTRQSS
jgi:hypothetical protein